MEKDLTYTSGLSAKGALIEETLTVLRGLDQGLSVAEIKRQVLEQDVLGKDSRLTRESVWDRIHARYLTDPQRAWMVARMAIHAPERQTQRLVLFYEFCRAAPLLRDVTRDCIYPHYQAGFVGVDKSLIQRYLDDLAATHPELTTWSPQTRGKVVSNSLSILRDFGLLEGVQQKRFARVYVPLPAFVYGLYRLAGDGVTAPTPVLAARDWRLFLLSAADVVLLLEEAAAAGHCSFKHQGDIYLLDFTYPSLEVCVATLTGEV